jgi:hypothetical protein
LRQAWLGRIKREGASSFWAPPKLVGHQAFVFPRIGVSDLNRARKRKIDEIRLNDQIFRVVTTPNLISDRSNVLGAAQSVGHA